jgi:hypothetical protein
MDRVPEGAGELADYLSYLLRLWREGEPGHNWRASLENVATGERRGFAGLGDLISFLYQQTEGAPATRPDEAALDERR